MSEENRRTFLKTVGVAVGAAGLTGTGVALAQEDDDSDDGDETGDVGSWTSFRGGSARTGATDDDGPAPYATTDWSMDAGGALRVGTRSYVVEPVLHDGTLYLAVATDTGTYASDGFIAAYDPETGDELWKHTDLPAPKTPTVGNGTLYFGIDVPGSQAGRPENTLFALDAETGETKWSRGDHVEWEDPVLVDGHLYTAYSEYSNESGTVALDPETGDTVWETSDVSGEVCYADGTLFVRTGTALNADDGSVKWTQEMASLEAVHDGLVYGTARRDEEPGYRLHAWSASDGTEQWKQIIPRDPGEYKITNLAIGNGQVFVFTHDGNPDVSSDDVQKLHAFDAETGAPEWTFESFASMYGDPVVADGTVYLGGRYAPESEPDPVPANYKAFVYAIDADSGESEWSYVLDSRNTASTPVASDGKVYVPTFEGDSQYAEYVDSELFVLEACNERPDADHRIASDSTTDPDDGEDGDAGNGGDQDDGSSDDQQGDSDENDC
ncbi:PQQ-binding-like beta-propeller repeat protein [Haladaptatus caseinilyticus]|uniref:PQQ-binding-like beta-propeller repeat protein n=1 Tax=Haladaptatus caseinilyticus TaxID=2993314 RepID=UPI00224B7FCD|nr:PQQ-binding-like beta-propeller repeat protein [Haladaptatus caseinilyticus]